MTDHNGQNDVQRAHVALLLAVLDSDDTAARAIVGTGPVAELALLQADEIIGGIDPPELPAFRHALVSGDYLAMGDG